MLQDLIADLPKITEQDRAKLVAALKPILDDYLSEAFSEAAQVRLNLGSFSHGPKPDICAMDCWLLRHKNSLNNL